MAKQTITIYDVAREAGVSMATVSRVVNGNPNVKPSTRKKVSDVIDRLKYRPNAVARGLASKKTTTVGVIIPDVTNMYFSSLARGIDDIASMYNYNIILANSDGDSEKEIRVLNTVLAQQVDGVIFMGHQLSAEVRKEIDLTDTPVVLAATLDEQDELPNITIDYEEAIYDSTKMLLENGNDKVALFGMDIDAIKQTLTTKGYRRAVEDAGKSFDESLIVRVSSDRKTLDDDDFAEKILETGATAAVVEDDRYAINLLNQLTEKGVKIPEDFEIISAKNSPLIDIVRPRITTITQPLYDLGAVAMRLLTKLMNDEENDEIHITLPYKFSKQESTK